MPIRSFVDAEGVSWRVWATTPSSGTVLSSGFEQGWLTFECDNGGLRRLAPIPTGWEDAPQQKLNLFCRAAREMPRRTTPVSGEVIKQESQARMSETETGPSSSA